MVKGGNTYTVRDPKGEPMDWPAMGQSRGVSWGEADAIIKCSILTGAHPDYWRIIRDADGAEMPRYLGPPVDVKKTSRKRKTNKKKPK